MNTWGGQRYSTLWNPERATGGFRLPVAVYLSNEGEQLDFPRYGAAQGLAAASSRTSLEVVTGARHIPPIQA